MNHLGSRGIIPIALGVLFLANAGLVAGRYVGRAPTRVLVASAAYPQYDSVDALRAEADVVVLGEVSDDGSPYLDDGGINVPEGNAVPMRAYSVAVLRKEGSTGVEPVIQVATTDSAEIGISGDASLHKGDKVYLFLEALSSDDYFLQVPFDHFYVVVGGFQGVFRESSDGVWQQDQDLTSHQEDRVSEELPTPIVVNERELRNAEAG